MTDVRPTLRALAQALPEGSAMLVPVAWVLELTEPTAVHASLLTPAQCAARMGVTVSYLYRKTDLPFRRKLSHRHLAFDAAGLEAWLAERNAA